VTDGTDRTPQADEVLDSLVQVSFTVIALVSQVAAAHDLSLTQVRVLTILRDHQPTMAGLAAHLGLERSTVSGLIDRAVKRGLVRRDASSDDARAVRVSLSPDGYLLAARLTDELARRISPMVDLLNPAEQKRLVALLRGLLE